MMDDNLLSKFEELRCAVSKLEVLSRKLLGFFQTILYEDILFHVSPEFVIADLSPLAFFNLVEYIDSDGAEAAAVRLYERFLPLLSCSHRWIEPTIPLDQDGKPIISGPLQEFGRVFVCEFCTAYAIKTAEAHLPTVGRSVYDLNSKASSL